MKVVPPGPRTRPAAQLPEQAPTLGAFVSSHFIAFISRDTFQHPPPRDAMKQKASPHARRPAVFRPRPPLPSSTGGPNQTPPASVTQYSNSAADSDAPPGGYAPGQADTTPDTESPTRAAVASTAGANAGAAYAQSAAAPSGGGSYQSGYTP